MSKVKILFFCTFRGGRARIAEVIANELVSTDIAFYASGFESGAIGGLCQKVMQEDGFNFPDTPLKTVFERSFDKERFDFVVAMCDPVTYENCSLLLESISNIFSDGHPLTHWSVPDFSTLTGTDIERKQQSEDIRDMIKTLVSNFLVDLDSGL